MHSTKGTDEQVPGLHSNARTATGRQHGARIARADDDHSKLPSHLILYGKGIKQCRRSLPALPTHRRADFERYHKITSMRDDTHDLLTRRAFLRTSVLGAALSW